MIVGGVLIHIIGYAAEEPTPFDGQYLVEYDPGTPSTAADGTQLPFTLLTSPDKSKARVFGDLRQALETWRREHGVRQDGRPNRPLTAWHIEFESAEAVS